MKTRQRFAALFAAAFILGGSVPGFTGKADATPEEPGSEFAETTQPETLPVETESILPDEAPAFQAHIELRMGYAVIGTFTDFTPDIVQIQTLYSLDGENWKVNTFEWNLFGLDSDDESKREALQNQPCLVSNDEPLKRYIAGEIDRFYLKLRITTTNGLSYETQSAVIARGDSRPVPENAVCRALFSSAIAVTEPDPASLFRYRKYGSYQITVSADATAEEIAALLPDTLPVEVQIDGEPGFQAIGVVDCPVTWKPLALPPLSSSESITIPHAAEEILVPAGTPVSTPLGIFLLNEPLSLDTLPSTDEVRLVLNVCPEDKNPEGVLKEDADGLKISFYQKPSGATSIQAYVLTEEEGRWTELPGLSLLEEINAQPSTENSGYALVLRRDQEPYQSYLAARKEDMTPTPFFIGLKIEGGVYDGKQLILAWPDIYEELPDLPKVGGAEGNEGNAGADDKNDSTDGGQRPDLPQTPQETTEEQTPADGRESEPENESEEQTDAGGKESEPENESREQTDAGSKESEPEIESSEQTDAGSKESEPKNESSEQTDAGGKESEPKSESSEQTTAGGKESELENESREQTTAGGVETESANKSEEQTAPDGTKPEPENESEKQTSADDAEAESESKSEEQTAPDRTKSESENTSKERTAPDRTRPEPESNPARQATATGTETRPESFYEEPAPANGAQAKPSVSNRENPPAAQDEADCKQEADIPPLSDGEPAMESADGQSSHIPLLPAAATVTAGGCIGAAACKAARCRPFQRIAAKIRRMLSR